MVPVAPGVADGAAGRRRALYDRSGAWSRHLRSAQDERRVPLQHHVPDEDPTNLSCCLQLDAWEVFTLEHLGGDRISLRSAAHGKLLCVEPNADVQVGLLQSNCWRPA
jgi:hypothetical protein